jgi:hypothetical protein
MKRIVLSLLIGTLVFATVAFAADLTVYLGGLQSGAVSAECDADGVIVTFQDTDTNGNFDQATLEDVECRGLLDVKVTTYDASDAQVGAGATGCGAQGPTILVTLGDALNAADIAAADETAVQIVQCGTP